VSSHDGDGKSFVDRKSTFKTQQTRKVKQRRRLKPTDRIKLVESVSNAVSLSRYRSAFKQLLDTGPAAKRAFNEIARREVRKQVSSYIRSNDTQFPQLVGIKSVEEFSWTELIAILAENLPTLYSAICGSMYNGRNAKSATQTR